MAETMMIGSFSLLQFHIKNLGLHRTEENVKWLQCCFCNPSRVFISEQFLALPKGISTCLNKHENILLISEFNGNIEMDTSKIYKYMLFL